jgi:hypothetical protein
MMILFEKRPMTFEGMAYEIRVLYDNTVINVVAFRDNHPANGFRHQIKIPKNCDAKAILNKGAATELVEMSKSDVMNKRWEGLNKILSESVKSA